MYKIKTGENYIEISPNRIGYFYIREEYENAEVGYFSPTKNEFESPLGIIDPSNYQVKPEQLFYFFHEAQKQATGRLVFEWVEYELELD